MVGELASAALLAVGAVALALPPALSLGLHAAQPARRPLGRWWRRFLWLGADLATALPPVAIAVAALKWIPIGVPPWLAAAAGLVLFLIPRLALQFGQILFLRYDEHLPSLDALGASPWRGLMRVSFPAARPGIAGACLVAVSIVMAEAMIPLLLLGAPPPFLGAPPAAAQTAAGLLGVSWLSSAPDGSAAAGIRVQLALLVAAVIVLRLAGHAMWRHAGGGAWDLWWPSQPHPIFDAVRRPSASAGPRLLSTGIFAAGSLAGAAGPALLALVFLAAGSPETAALTSLALTVSIAGGGLLAALFFAVFIARAKPAWIALCSAPPIAWAYAASAAFGQTGVPIDHWSFLAATAALGAALTPAASAALADAIQPHRLQTARLLGAPRWKALAASLAGGGQLLVSRILIVWAAGIGMAAPLLFLASGLELGHMAVELAAQLGSGVAEIREGGMPAYDPGLLAWVAGVPVLARLIARTAQKGADVRVDG